MTNMTISEFEKGKIPGYKRLESQEMKIEACMGLAGALLSITYSDYESCLKTIIKIRKISNPTYKDKRRLFLAYKMKHECENYYLSTFYEACTLGRGLPGDEVIREIKRRVGFVD